MKAGIGKAALGSQELRVCLAMRRALWGGAVSGVAQSCNCFFLMGARWGRIIIRIHKRQGEWLLLDRIVCYVDKGWLEKFACDSRVSCCHWGCKSSLLSKQVVIQGLSQATQLSHQIRVRLRCCWDYGLRVYR
eukprot:4999618-Amphidinium_carterae.3